MNMIFLEAEEVTALQVDFKRSLYQLLYLIDTCCILWRLISRDAPTYIGGVYVKLELI